MGAVKYGIGGGIAAAAIAAGLMCSPVVAMAETAAPAEPDPQAQTLAAEGTEKVVEPAEQEPAQEPAPAEQEPAPAEPTSVVQVPAQEAAPAEPTSVVQVPEQTDPVASMADQQASMADQQRNAADKAEGPVAEVPAADPVPAEQPTPTAEPADLAAVIPEVEPVAAPVSTPAADTRASQPQTSLAVSLLRLYNTTTGEHLYTTHPEEASYLSVRGWNLEADQTSAVPESSGRPVWRLYNPQTNDHHYTSDTNETRVLSTERGWIFDFSGNPAFYSADPKDGVPVLRIYNWQQDVYGHLFTTDANEKKVHMAEGVWNDEGTAWYTAKASANYTSSANNGWRSSIKTTNTAEGPYLFIPSNVDLHSVELRAANGARLLVASTQDGNYERVSDGRIDLTRFNADGNGVYRLFVKEEGSDYAMLVRAMKSRSVGTMFLLSDDRMRAGRYFIDSSPFHADTTTGSMLYIKPDGTIAYNGKLTQIKGRGNSTWSSAKKPYQIKLDEKTALVGGKGNKSKKWVLLANAFDPTLVHNKVAYDLGKAAGVESSPDSETIDLYYDGEYRGTYQLSEKAEIGKGRLEIDELENGSLDGTDIEKHATATGTNRFGRSFQYVEGVKQPGNISGGYLLELDVEHWTAERSWFDTSLGHFVLKTPEDASEAEVRYISERVQEAIDNANGANAAAYWDVDSWVRVFLTQELAKNPDFMAYSSTYFYKKANDDLLYSGPIWDFDLAFGVNPSKATFTDPTGLTSTHPYPWLENAQFKSAVKKVFNDEFRPLVQDSLLGDAGKMDSIRADADQVAASQKMNAKLWPLVDPVYNNIYSSTSGSHQNDVNRMVDWVQKRINWMTSWVNGL